MHVSAPQPVDRLRRQAEYFGDRNDAMSWRLSDAANALEYIEAQMKMAARTMGMVNAADDDGDPGERTTSAERN